MKENRKLAMNRPTLRDWAKGISLNRKKNKKTTTTTNRSWRLGRKNQKSKNTGSYNILSFF